MRQELLDNVDTWKFETSLYVYHWYGTGMEGQQRPEEGYPETAPTCRSKRLCIVTAATQSGIRAEAWAR